MQNMTITLASGSNLAVKIDGDESWPTIMLLNGSIFNYHQFEPVYKPQLKKYLKHNYRIIQYDYEGIGQSSPKKHNFDFLTIVDQHIELMDSLNIEKCHLFGISKGSIIGQIISGKYNNRVLSFSGYGNPFLSTTNTKNDFKDRVENILLLQDIFDSQVDHNNFGRVFDTVYVPTIYYKKINELTPFEKLKNIWVKWKVKPMLIGVLIKNIHTLFLKYTETINVDDMNKYIEILKSISCPVLLIHGSKDETVPYLSSIELSKIIKHAKLKIIDGLSHSRPTVIPWEGSKIMREYANFINSLN